MNDQTPENDQENDFVWRALEALSQDQPEWLNAPDENTAYFRLRRALLANDDSDQNQTGGKEWIRASLLRIIRGNTVEAEELTDYLEKSGMYATEELIRMRRSLLRYTRSASSHHH
jgi:hypothetical protein